MWGQGLLRPVAGKDPKHMQQQVCRNVHWFARESKDSGGRTLGFAFHMPYPRPLIIFVERGWNYGKYMTDSLWLEFMVSVNTIQCQKWKRWIWDYRKASHLILGVWFYMWSLKNLWHAISQSSWSDVRILCILVIVPSLLQLLLLSKDRWNGKNGTIF